jgi:L-fuculose-phosphate aldolase
MNSESISLKKEIIAACLRLEKLGYVIGTYGNVSARVPGGLIITPSRVDYRSLTPDDLVTVSLEGRVLEGTRLPSSELEVHRQIYVRRPDVCAIAHTHSLFATALSCVHETIPVMVEEQSQVIGDEIRCTRYVPAGKHRALGQEVARTLGKSSAVLLANHGTLSCGRSLAEALFTCQIVERIAQMRLLAGGKGKVIPIPREFVRSERERWLHKYGASADKAVAERNSKRT